MNRYSLLILGIAGSLSAICNQAFGDVYNRQVTPLGEAEMFMGNAGTGRASGPGSLYYNPAGLADTAQDTISVSGSVYVSTTSEIDSIAQLGQDSVPVQSTQFNSIPSTTVSVKRLGEWALGLGVLVPDYDKSDLVVTANTATRRLSIVNSSSSSDLWIGGAVARKLDHHWSIGLTLFGINHSQIAVGGADLHNLETNTLTASTTRISLNNIGFSAALGVKFLLSPEFSLGLRLQTPILQVSGKGSVYQSIFTDQSGTITSRTVDEKNLQSKYQLPWDLTLGLSWRILPEWLWAADGSFQFPVNYTNLPSSPAFDTRLQSQPTYRINTGTEVRASKHVPLRAGFAYNPSAIHSSSGLSAGNSRVDYYTFTIGAALESKHISTGIGGIYSWGKVEGLPLGASASVVGGSTRAIGGLLTTSYLF